MAKSTAGKWVSSVGAAGGGKSYKKSRPGNFYGALAVIVVLGLALTVYSRYEYQNPHATHSSSVAPAIGSTQYAALSVQACGRTLPNLQSDPTYRGGYIVLNNDVLRVTPVVASEAGNNATLAEFTKEYPGLVATSRELAVPSKNGVTTSATTFKNGQACAKTSKYAGRTGKVVYAYWTSFAQKSPTLTTNPASIKFTKDMRVTLAFEPAGVTPLAPSKVSVDAMFLAATTPTTTTTTTPKIVPSSTTTTTAKSGSTTTTTKKG